MAIISCPECKDKVSDKALNCPHCGFPIQQIPAQQPITRTRQPKRRRKLPNGFGSIKKLSGHRRNPFAAYPPVTEYHMNGTPKSVPAIGYYPTYDEAYEALSSYRKNPFDINLANATFAEIFELWIVTYLNGPKEKSDSAVSSYKTAFKNCKKLHNMKFRDIRKFEMQQALDSCELGYSSLTNIKKLYSQMYKFALENDIVSKDYSKFVTINKEDDNEKGVPFTLKELKILWEHRDDVVVSMILFMCFTGFRIGELENNKKKNYKMEVNLEERYLRGGNKTASGKERTVPYNKWLLPFVNVYLSIKDEFKAKSFRAEKFYPKLQELGIAMTEDGKKHTPHDCRHTFSWICDRAEMDELSKHLIMGHSLGNDVEKSVYGHRTLDDLHKAISKIKLEDLSLICH